MIPLACHVVRVVLSRSIMVKGLKVERGLPGGIIYLQPAWEQLAVPQEELEIIAGETKLLNIVLKVLWNMWKISNTVDAKCSLFSTRDNFLLADLSLAGKRTHYLAFPGRSRS